MKKFTLLLCLFVVSVMMPQLAMAEGEPTTTTLSASSPVITKSSDGVLTITSTAAGELKSYVVDNASAHSTEIDAMKTCTSLVLINKFSSDDLDAVKYDRGFIFTVVDMSQAVFPKSIKNYWAKVGYMPSNANDGDKCFVGDLYKLSITSNKKWQACSEFQTDLEYESNTVMDSKKGERNPGDYAKINRYHYYKITTQTRNGWSESMNNRPGNGSLISGTFNEQALPDATNYNKADYLEFEQSRTYFRFAPSLKWEYLNDNSQINSNAPETNWDPSNINNWSTDNYSYGDQVKKTNGDNVQYFIVVYGDKNNWSWVEINANDVTDEIRAAATLQNDKANHKNDYNANAYIYEATYHYYQVVDTQVKEWDGPYDTQVGNNIIMTPGFTEEQRASNTNYDNEQGVRFYVRTDYYVLVEDQTRTWSIANENTEHVEHFFANDEARDADTQANDGDYAIVGSTIEYVWKNNAWNVSSGVVEYDWTQMRFDYWSNSLITAKLPAGVYSTDLYSNSPLNGCVLVTTVQSGNTTATITQYENYAVAVLDVPSNSSEFTRMKDILEKNNFVKTGEVTSSVGDVGYNSTTKTYTVQGALSSVIGEINTEVAVGGDEIDVLDLKNATFEKGDLALLTKSTIDYIILPGGKDKAFVCDSINYYSGTPKELNMTNLKAVISAQSTNLVAHVVVPGHLAQARCYATGLSHNKEGNPAVVGLTSVTLSGSLNDSDISTKGENNGLSGEMHTIETIDLEKAIFPNNDDMHFLNAGFQGGPNDNCHLSKISLPIDPRMIHIPADCFRNLKSLDSLCIPFNYQYIHDGALYDSSIEHLTTTDSIGGAVIDHGMYTYTLSANVLEIGDAPNPKIFAGVPQGTPGEYVFPKENGVTEFYSLATMVPKCYKNAFSYDLTFGYGGQDQTKVYGRDRYFNNGERSKSFVVLRYPSKEVFARRKAKGKPVELPNGTVEEGYALMEQKYTDVTKVYTKKDQTGAVDANGNPLLWPARTEGNRAYNQASAGVLWDDWGKSYTGENDSEINDGDDVAMLSLYNSFSRVTRGGEPQTKSIDVTQGREGNTENGYWVPQESLQHMFKYDNMPVIYDNVKYKKLVLEFESAISDSIMLHAYGAHDSIYSLKGLDRYEITLNGNPIDEFSIFNWWGRTGESHKVKITQAYFTTEDSRLDIDLTKGMSAEGVTRNYNDGSYTFTPTANVKNMFQYLNMPVGRNGGRYSKIVIRFAEAVPEGFKIHAYGDRGEWTSLKGKTEIEIPLTGNNIDDFTIFNWDDSYWTDNGFVNSSDAANPRKITITEAYFTTEKYEEPVNSKVHGDLVDYLGWHQIVLTQPEYYEPVEKKEGDKIKRNYKQTGYCTFCIPYDMTYSQVVKMLGIPASTDKVNNYLNGEGDPIAEDRMPDIRQLYSVTRTAGSGSDKNSVLFRLSKNLVTANGVEYLDFEDSDGKVVPVRKYAKDRYVVGQHGILTDTKKPADKDERCIVGGRPYIINAYMPYVNAKDSIPLRNLGLYVMTRFADELSDTASCVNNGIEYYEQLSIYEEQGSGNRDGETKVVKVLEDEELTMRFAKPYEGHKVQAYSNEANMTALVYDHEKLDKSTERDKYYYTMVGQFWEQELPLYAIYMTRKGEWKRYANDYHIKWDPYKCVIMATPDITSNEFVDSATVVKSLIPDEETKKLIKDDQEINKKDTLTKPYDYVSTFEHFGGGFRSLANCYFPMNYKDTYDWIPAPMKLWFCGRDDSSFQYFKPNNNNTRYIFVMDDEDEIIEYGDEVTNVKSIDTLDGVPQLTDKSRVYNLSGQYMGNNTNGLPKGVYIVDGRKIVVE